jgi:arabinofuranosyltransferase
VDPYWRIGHFERTLPEGYAETLESGENRIADPNLAEYYDALRRVIAGPLISGERMRDIVRLNLGYYDHLIEAYVESLPLKVPISELSTSSTGAPSSEDQAIEIPSVGVRVDLGGLSYARGVRVHVDRNADYQVIFTRAGEEVTRKLIAASTDVQPIRVGISAQAAQEGYDAITLHPVDERGLIFLYSVALLEE